MGKGAARLFAVIMVLSMLLSVSAAASGSSEESTKRADALYGMGLLKGTGSGYDLDASPTRVQGLIMLIRLLGEESKALSGNDPEVFTDVPQWADRYVSYGAAKGYTKGTGGGLFSPDSTLDAKSYVTFVLRALGYSDNSGDFSWASALKNSASLGLMTASSASALDSAAFNRGDMSDISYSSLTMPLKGKTQTLAQKLLSAGVFTGTQGTAGGVLGTHTPLSYVPYDGSTVSYAQNTYSLDSGDVTADVVTVNLLNPRVTVKSAMVDNTLGATAPFEDIVSESGADVAINANFFEAYQNFKIPIGHVVCDGNFLYGDSGLTAFGFTSDNKVKVGRPAFFFRVAVPGSNTKNWPCYELNTTDQSDDNSIVYTPAYGSYFYVSCGGTYVVVKSGAITEIGTCQAGDTLYIPSDGYIMWLSSDYTSTDYYTAPTAGDKVTLTPYLIKADEEGFTFDNVVSLVSGAPRLVKDGKIETYLDPGFTEERFTTDSAPRTAIGTLPNGKLVLVSVGSATIEEMRELMLALGCADAVNLDGGGSSAMYYEGNYIRSPGRELTVTLQVFVS